MTEVSMMACGCAADSHDTDGSPACSMHMYRSEGKQVVPSPDLRGRVAKCHCNEVRPSSMDLAFFQYRGEDSPDAINTCKHCKFHWQAHEHDNHRVFANSVVEDGKCPGFEPHGAWDFDLFFCGCSGWD
jgi:hypothetical protein